MSTLRYINYNRKSTESEDKQLLSIIAQQEVAAAIAHKENIVMGKIINESKSAKIPGRRSGFKQMVGSIRKGHSIATHLLENGMEIENIALLLGHDSLESTQIYTHVAELGAASGEMR